MNNNQKIITLLDQMIEYNIYQDIKNEEKDGENWNLYHLKLLKELILNEKEK
jgi:hypothetical protein